MHPGTKDNVSVLTSSVKVGERRSETPETDKLLNPASGGEAATDANFTPNAATWGEAVAKGAWPASWDPPTDN